MRDWTNILLNILIVIIFIMAVGSIGIYIYVLINYGGLPISEVPSWAIPWLLGGRR